MNLHRSGVERERFDPDAHDLLQLELLEHAIQDAVLCPPIHTHIDRVPATKPLWKSPPFAALFRHVQDRVQDLQVAQTHIAALYRQTILDASVLLFRDFHASNILVQQCLIV